MSNADALELNGTIVDLLPGAKFMVELENGHKVTGHLSGKMRQHKIKLITGDSVTIEMSPYDLTKGRITWRNK